MSFVSWQSLTNVSVLLAAAGNPAPRDVFWRLAERLVFWVAILAALLAIAFYVLAKIRPKPVQKELRASDWLSKYRDLHSQGKLSDEEFRTIKTTLAEQLQDELNDTGETGYAANEGDKGRDAFSGETPKK